MWKFVPSLISLLILAACGPRASAITLPVGQMNSVAAPPTCQRTELAQGPWLWNFLNPWSVRTSAESDLSSREWEDFAEPVAVSAVGAGPVHSEAENYFLPAAPPTPLRDNADQTGSTGDGTSRSSERDGPSLMGIGIQAELTSPAACVRMSLHEDPLAPSMYTDGVFRPPRG